MALVWGDRILETSVSTGTGAFSLAGAVTGYQRFSAVCSVSDTIYYAIFAVESDVPSGAWETGIGTYSAANTLTRTTVLSSSNGGSAVNFAAGDKQVLASPTASFVNGLYRSGGTDVAIADGGTGASTAATARTNLLLNVITPVFNFSAAGETRFYAETAMTLTQQGTSGTGTVAYEKSTAAAPGTFASTSSPVTLEAGAWLKVTASAVTGTYAVAMKRTA